MKDARAIAILGAGTMGEGIAHVIASRGFEVRLYDLERKRSQEALARIRDRTLRLVESGKITDDVRKTTLENLSLGFEPRELCRGVAMVIEAVAEDLDVKTTLFQNVLPVLSPDTLIATNTSSLSITTLGRALGESERVIGLHFFNPATVMDLVEVVRGYSTSEATVERALRFVQDIGKTPILVRDVPGFATSRLGVLLGAEAMRMVETGVASAHDIDTGMELGYRHPMGPLKLTDVVGLDVRLAILEHLQREIGDQFRPPVILRQLVRAGKLGKKTGEGFYRWVEGKPVVT
jgi:3-hydroxybutyryl-CoA dehydrogenase